LNFLKKILELFKKSSATSKFRKSWYADHGIKKKFQQNFSILPLEEEASFEIMPFFKFSRQQISEFSKSKYADLRCPTKQFYTKI
jgi:hypothetical protein